MKKFMKVCAITALILVVVGFAMTAIAGTVMGTQALESAIDSATNGKVHMNLDSISDWGITVGESVDDLGSAIGDGVGELGAAIGDGIAEGMDIEVNYDMDEVAIFDEDYEIFKGDVGGYSLGSDIEELDIEVGGCVFEIQPSEDQNYYIQADNTNKFQGYVEDGTLYVKATVKVATLGDAATGKITLYVPAAWEEKGLKKVDMELGAGVMTLDALRADKIVLEVGAGQINASQLVSDKLEISVGMGEILVNDMQVNDLDAEVGMGHLYVEGDVNNKADVECSMGSLEMKLAGAQTDFDYEVECGMGNIDLGRDSYSGVAQERSVDNGASKKMYVECAMGDVKISFTE